MKQKAFAWGFILFFIATFIAFGANAGFDFEKLHLWDIIFLSIPCGFIGFLGGAIAMVMVKKKSADEE